MAKEKENYELRPVEEEAEKVTRYLRLKPDTVEEVEELPPVRLGERHSLEATQASETGKTPRTRSIEPDIASLIEKEENVADDEWEFAHGNSKRVPLGWVIVVACVFAGAILWSLVAVKRADRTLDLRLDRTERLKEDLFKEERDAEELISNIEDVVYGFFGSGSVEGMLGFVRHPGRVAPLMERHYGDSPPRAVRVEKMLTLVPLTMDNRANFWVASCEFGDGQVSQVLVEVDPAHGPKVDWESYVSYQPMDWDDFARSRPGGYTGDFRVYVQSDNFYSYEFSDSGVFASFRLTALGRDEALYGYTPHDGTLAQQLEEILRRNGGRATPMILRLQLPNGLESKRGVVIEALVAPRWVLVDNPEKENP